MISSRSTKHRTHRAGYGGRPLTPIVKKHRFLRRVNPAAVITNPTVSQIRAHSTHPVLAFHRDDTRRRPGHNLAYRPPICRSALPSKADAHTPPGYVCKVPTRDIRSASGITGSTASEDKKAAARRYNPNPPSRSTKRNLVMLWTTIREGSWNQANSASGFNLFPGPHARVISRK